MLGNFKLRSKVEGPVCISKALKTNANKTEMARRIQTEINEEHLRGGKDSAVKRINISGRPPLADNKTLLNDPKKGVDALRQSDMKNNFSSSSIKASTRIKSILANNNVNTGLVGTTEKKREGPSRPLQTMVTEPYEKPSKPSTAGQQRTTDSMVQRLFNKDSKKTSSVKEEKSTILAKKEPISPASKYVFEEVVGSGTFGVVYKGRNKDTLDVVAIKKVLQDKKYKNREFEILKQLHHVNVLKMKEAFFTQDGQQEFLNVIMDYFPDTVYSVIKNYNRKRVMPDPLLKIYAYQLFRSLLYLNKISICHRDIKPHNILIDQRSNQLVMCDFGSAKKLVKGEPNIAYICSRCYRAPELIFGATDYTTQIDMWSAGCVLVEMIICEPLFIASNNIDQLVEIIRVLGTPTVDEVLAMNPQYDMSQFRFPKINAREWRKVVKEKVDPQLIDLIQHVMRYHPSQRFTPFQALAHPYFDELRDQKKFEELRKQMPVPQLFDFTEEECTYEEYQTLMPSWCSRK